MEDEIYKTIQVKTPKDNPYHNGLFDTNHGKVLFRDGKWLFDKDDMAQYDKELFWHKRISKKEYLGQFKKEIELQVLKDVQMLFKIQSDLSCDTNGYRRLNERIEQLTKQNES